jgi:UDP-glucose 4-epimerase
MRIVVTGGAGFIGSAITHRAVSGGHDVLVVDDLSTGRREQVHPSAEFVHADAGDCHRYHDAEAIIHCAAHADIADNWIDPAGRWRQWDKTATPTLEVLERAPKGCAFVLLSTAAVYEQGEVDETTPVLATSPYVACKLACEHLVQAYDVAGRVDGAVLRLVNVVGPRYRHGHIADFVRMASEGRIDARDNGVNRKSFVHVEDVADAALDAIGKMGTYNVTSPTSWSWPDTVALMHAMRPARPFVLNVQNKDRGWIGDPGNLIVKSVHKRATSRNVLDGVRESLEGLGW